MEPNRYRGFKDLDCWNEARKLRQEMTFLARTFPADEKFLLTNQLIRSARSVTANIAEGYGRFTYTDTRHFFIQSRGQLLK